MIASLNQMEVDTDDDKRDSDSVLRGRPHYHGKRVKGNIPVGAEEDGDRLMEGEVDENVQIQVVDHFQYPFKSNIYAVCELFV